jgi:Zn-dependent protease
MYSLGIVAGLILVFFGIVFVAPGFVEILPYSYGRWGFRVVSLGVEQIGAIALSGIGVNLGLAVLFKLLSLNWPLFGIFYKINALIAFFNLLPAPPLDGSKIISWSAGVWVFLFIISLLMIADIFVF